ncbi:MAG: UpxY family transcription antiterminator [Bacteroidota bacterium]
MDNSKDTFWFAVYTNPRAEKKVYERITHLKFNAYLPLISTLKIWSDRKKKVSIPLIPSYVFVFCKKEELIKVLSLQGVVKILTFKGVPAIVKQHEITNMKILLQDFDQVESYEQISILKGEKVEVINGPFLGLIAQAIDYQGNYRLVVELEVFKRFLTVNVPISFVRRFSE